jgi:tight adherence protein B
MSALIWLVVGLGAVTVLVVWPRWAMRARWRRLLRLTRPRSAIGRRLRGLSDRARWRGLMVSSVLVAGSSGLALAGPVAGLALAAYSWAGLHFLRRGLNERKQARARSAAVDSAVALAAELRAGLPVATAVGRADLPLVPDDVERATGPGDAVVMQRVRAAVMVAEASGAPLADVLDRLDVDLRAGDRARATAQAQAAGAKASAVLLAAMPVAGLGLGALIGIDPLRVLLHTPIGAACMTAAVLLQIAGVEWSTRLTRVAVAP